MPTFETKPGQAWEDFAIRYPTGETECKECHEKFTAWSDFDRHMNISHSIMTISGLGIRPTE